MSGPLLSRQATFSEKIDSTTYRKGPSLGEVSGGYVVARANLTSSISGTIGMNGEYQREGMPRTSEHQGLKDAYTANDDFMKANGAALLDSRIPQAAADNDWEKVRQHIRELGPEAINSRDAGGSTVLHWAIRFGKTPFVKELLDDEKTGATINLNALDNNCMTPIMLAVQYERTKILYHLLEKGADYEHENAQGQTAMQLLSHMMAESLLDLRLEKEVIESAMLKVDNSIAQARASGVVGLLNVLKTQGSVVAWRKVCGILLDMIDNEAATGEQERPVTKQIYNLGFHSFLGFADLSKPYVQARRVVPVANLLVALAEAGMFQITHASVKVLEQMLTSCTSSTSVVLRNTACRIIAALTSTKTLMASPNAVALLVKSRCADPLYLIAFFDDDEDQRQMAKESLSKLGLDPSKPPDILNWGSSEVMMWLSMSVNFDIDAAVAIKEENVDGPSLLFLNDVLVSRIKALNTKLCIDLLSAVEQLKAVHKSWTGYDVFFSYDRASGSALVKLYALQMRGVYNCFIDMEGLTSTEFQAEQIYGRVEECRFFVVFITDKSAENFQNPKDWVLLEIQKALELNKIIIPVFYHTQPPSKDAFPHTIRAVLKFQAIMHSRDATEESCVRQLVEWLQDFDNQRRSSFSNFRSFDSRTSSGGELRQASSGGDSINHLSSINYQLQASYSEAGEFEVEASAGSTSVNVNELLNNSIA